MDRPISRKNRKTLLMLAWASTFLVLIGYLVVVAASRVPTVRFEKKTVVVGEVTRGPFREYIAVTGRTAPLRTFYLDAVQGGRITKVHVFEGDLVEAGDPLVTLASDDLDLELMAAENSLERARGEHAKARMRAERSELEARARLAELEYVRKREQRKYERTRDLAENGLVSRYELEEATDNFHYARLNKQLAEEAAAKNVSLNQAEIESLEEAVARAAGNLDLIRAKTRRLVVRAGVTGRLAVLDAEVGQVKSANQRIGRIDDSNGFKLVAEIDQFYLPRVTPELRGEADLAGKPYPLMIDKIYPTVVEGRFKVDFLFREEPVAALKSGGAVQISLPLSDPRTAVLLPRAAFVNQTGGGWIFVMTGEDIAERRSIRLGRQNPRSLEVLEGLNPGERVLLSHYDRLGNAERVILYP